jgi:hypothetical protein
VAVVTIRRRSQFGEAPDLTPEEIQRRRDAADAMFQDFKRQLAQRRQIAADELRRASRVIWARARA